MLNWIVWNEIVFDIEIHRPHLCPGYDTKQFDGEVPVMQELWGILRTPSLALLPGPLCPGMVALDKALCMGQIEQNCIEQNWTELFELELFD